jgi:hypothetical protein
MKAMKEIIEWMLRAVVTLALMLQLAPLAVAQDAKAQPVAATRVGAAAKPSGGPQEGIKVHGRWVIEVRNPDGTLAARREFDNALTGGSQNLSGLLSRSEVAGRWELNFTAPAGATSPCDGGSGGRSANWCRIIEAAASNPNGGNAESRNLTVTGSSTGTTVTLSGSITALANGAVGRVSTSLGGCTANTLVASCNAAGSAVFFSDASPSVIQVVAGQIIQVTVTFSFS